MKYIEKKTANEPTAFKKYREGLNEQSLTPDYDGYVDKDIDTGEEKPLKNALGTEQGWLCCYCMRRIWPHQMSVEHYIPQNRHKDSPFEEKVHLKSRLDFLNLLGSCNSKERACSEIRGNQPLIRIDPRVPACQSLISYQMATDKLNPKAEAILITPTGLYSEQLEKDVDILELNLLAKARFQVILKVQSELVEQKPTGGWTRKSLENKLTEWLALKTIDKYGMKGYREYCMVAIWYLQQKLYRPKYNR